MQDKFCDLRSMFLEGPKQLCCDAMIFVDLVSLRYLLGFQGHELLDGCLVLTEADARFYTDRRYTEAMKDKLTSLGVAMVDWTDAPGVEQKFALLTQGRGDMFMLWGIEDVSHSLFLAATKGLASPSNPRRGRLRLRQGMVEALRQMKSEQEIACLERAGVAIDAALIETRRFIKPGMTELEIREFLNAQLRHFSGEDDLSFPTIVAFGANAADPHYATGSRDRQLKKREDLILIDCGIKVDGYAGDATVTWFVGKPSRQMQLVYSAVKEASEEVIRQLKPGMVTGCTAHQVADAVLKKYGFDGLVGHGLGHGVGLCVHEAPYLSARHPGGKTRLMFGNTFTVEPGYYIPGVGGVRLERSGVMTHIGFKPFNRLDFDLNEAVITFA